jgi:hypothetical protein
MQDEQPKGFLNRGITGLLLLFSIPALLTIGAMFVVIWIGRIPGGDDRLCQRQLSETITAEISVYAYQAGLSRFELQTISVNGSDLAVDDVGWPHGINCDENIVELSEGVYLLYTEKTIILSDNAGESWQSYNVCDEPRPSSGRCDAEPLSLLNISFDASAVGQFTVRESITDEYGQPLYENGQPRIASEWRIRTDDAGRNWLLESTD